MEMYSNFCGMIVKIRGMPWLTWTEIIHRCGLIKLIPNSWDVPQWLCLGSIVCYMSLCSNIHQPYHKL